MKYNSRITSKFLLEYSPPTQNDLRFTYDNPGEIYEKDTGETFVQDPSNPGVWIRK